MPPTPRNDGSRHSDAAWTFETWESCVAAMTRFAEEYAPHLLEGKQP